MVDLLKQGTGLLREDEVPELTWSEVASRAVENVPESGAKFFSDMWNAVRHPIDTGGTLYDVALGAVKLLNMEGEENDDRQEAMARQVGKFFADRYTTVPGFKRAVAEDPVGVMADLSTVLMGGGGALARAPGLAGKVGRAAGATGKAIDPFMLTTKGVQKAGAAALPAVRGVLGSMSGVGTEAIRMAGRAGMEGGEASRSFTRNMRGSSDLRNIVSKAKLALSELKQMKNRDYTSNMKTVQESKTVIPFQKVNDAFREVADRGSFKGVALSDSAESAFRKMADIIDDWRMRDPAEFHTPAGLDALKQKLNNVAEKFNPQQERQAYSMVSNVTAALRREIEKAAPGYAKAMREYEHAATEIRALENTMGLGRRATPDKALRALTSAFRNNVNTNFGYRQDLAQSLANTRGGSYLMEDLAGASFNSLMPRGIQRATTPAAAVSLFAHGNPLLAGGYLAGSSPRVVGEVSHAAGQATRLANSLADSRYGAQALSPASTMSAYQLGRLEEDLRSQGLYR